MFKILADGWVLSHGHPRQAPVWTFPCLLNSLPPQIEWPASSFCPSLCVHAAGNSFCYQFRNSPCFEPSGTLSLSSCSYCAPTNASKSQQSCTTLYCRLTLHLVKREPIFTLLEEHLLQLALVKISLCSEAQPQICSF